MIESQIVRRDRDLFTKFVPAPAELRAEQLREHFTATEARLFGIDLPYGGYAGQPVASPLLSGLGAALSTTFLFVAVGFLATLGLPDPGPAIDSVPAILA